MWFETVCNQFKNIATRNRYFLLCVCVIKIYIYIRLYAKIKQKPNFKLHRVKNWKKPVCSTCSKKKIYGFPPYLYI